MIILVILSCVGLSSYALFSYEIFSQNNIKVVFDDVKGPTCVIEGPDVSEISIESNATYTMNCIDSFGVSSSDLTSDNFTITGDITISNIAKEQIDNGYKYTITILSGTSDTTGNIKLNSNVIQDMNGNYNKESNVSSNIIVITFPSEPTEYVLIDTYTTSQTWNVPESGYFKIEVFGASGNGGNGYVVRRLRGGGGGGGGGYASSIYKMNEGDIITFNIGNILETTYIEINSSIETASTITITSGENGEDATSTSSTGGAGGVASGGNLSNINGSAGADGMSSGAGGTGGTGANGAPNGGNGETVSNPSSDATSGSSGFIKIYRGNTNTTN